MIIIILICVFHIRFAFLQGSLRSSPVVDFRGRLCNCLSRSLFYYFMQ